MFKTVKSKFSALYIGMVLLIIALGMISVFNTEQISRAIDGLISTNYNSIVRINSMRAALADQERCAAEYLYGDRIQAVIEFDGQVSIFRQYHRSEQETIIIPEEIQYINHIGDYYEGYVGMFEQLQTFDLSDQGQAARAEAYYKGTMKPQQKLVEQELDLLYASNESALFGRQDEASSSAHSATRILMVVFAVAAAAGLWFATLYTRRFLRPLHEITRNIRLVRQGNLNSSTSIATRDEFGLLADEFNNMLRRLAEFERTALGSIVLEKNRSDSILQNITEPVLMLDEAGKVAVMNHAFEELFSCVESECVGKGVREVIPSGEFTRYAIPGEAEDQLQEKQLIAVKGKEEDLFYHITATRIPGADGQTAGLILLLHNITEMKQLERSRSDFIATISHEFKTPLTSIVMGADMLGGGLLGSLNSDQKEVVDTIREDSERLEMLVGEMLELSRIESSKTIYQFASCSIGEIIGTSVRQFSPIAERNGISLTVDCPDGLPRVRADFAKITWVLNNLLSNALKYTGEGDRVSIDVRQEQTLMRITVEDTGIGIPPEFAEQVFEKFVQINGYDVEVRGSGLGLAAAREMIRAHGGKIWCDAKVEKGSRFVFTLPLLQEG